MNMRRKLKLKLKKDDEVIVIAGKDKGKIGKVLSVKNGKLTISGINLAKKHLKPNPQLKQEGGIVEKPMPVDYSNVLLVDPTTGKGGRVGIKTLTDGQRVRYFKKSGQVVDVEK